MTAERRRGRGKPSRIVIYATSLVAAGSVGYYAADRSPSELSRSFNTVAQSSLNPQTLVGRASVTDGDTIEIRGERIRLNGIDAPEMSQACLDNIGRSYRCGATVANAVAGFLKESSPTRCEFIERDQYGRFVGNCFRADGVSVQAALVRNGWAMDWPRHSGGAYAAEERLARREKAGIWSGTFQPPWEWRARQKAESQPVLQTPLIDRSSAKGCVIKGNVSADGERIYHIPGQKHYEKTRINTGRGERWFCSEREARAAGWRASRR